MKKGFDKRGQELSIGTLILIVLGVIVLVLLVLGFTLGWGNLWERINIFQGGSNIENVIQACQLNVINDASYAYCQDFKKVKVDGKTQYVNCQDPRVAGSLEKTFTCPSEIEYDVKGEGETEPVSIRERQCIELLKKESDAKKICDSEKGFETLVNGQACGKDAVEKYCSSLPDPKTDTTD